VIFLAWFYLTPVIYPLFYVRDNAPQFLPLVRANPMTWFVELFHGLLYGGAYPPLRDWLVCLGWAAVALGLGSWLFSRLAVTFAKEV